MRVPTTDYSPIIKATKTNTQAQQTAFIAPQIDYARKSAKNESRMMKLKAKGLELQQVSNFVNTGFGVVNSGISLMQNIYQDQMYQAAKLNQDQSKQTASAIIAGTANNSIWIGDDGNVNGMDTLNSLKESQMADIDNKKWFGSVKKQAKEGLESIYNDSQRAIMDQANRNAIQANFQHQQDLIGQYAKIDAGRLNAKEGEEYKLTFGYIDSLPVTAQQKEDLKFKARNNIDWMKAQNSVSDIARNTADYNAAIKEADRWADEKSFDDEQRESLYGIVARLTDKTLKQAEAAGFEYMAKGLQSGQTPTEIRKQAEQDYAGASEAKKNAAIAGLDKAQVNFCNSIVAETAKNMPETLTSADVKDGIEKLKEKGDFFQGCPDTEAILKNTIAKWKETEQILVADDYKEKYETIRSIYLPHLMDGTMSTNQVLDMIDSGMEIAKGNDDNNKIAAYQQFRQDVIKTAYKEFINPAVERADKTISETMKWWYGKDSFDGDPRAREQYNGIVREATAEIIDLCKNKGQLSNAEIDRLATDIMSKYANQEAVIRAAAEGNGYVAKQMKAETDVMNAATKSEDLTKIYNSMDELTPQERAIFIAEAYKAGSPYQKEIEEYDKRLKAIEGGVKTTSKTGEQEYASPTISDLYSRLTDAIKVENSNKDAAGKKGNYGDAEKSEKRAVALTKIQTRSLPILDDMVSKMQPSNREVFTDKVEQQYYILKKDPTGWLDKFEDTETSDKNPWIDNPGEDYTIKTSFQNMKLYDKELEDMYPLVSGTPEGRDYASRRNELDQAMITVLMSDVGRPVNPNGWKNPIYSPDDGGWTYKNGEDIYRVVRVGDGFKVERLWDNGKWVTQSPYREPINNPVNTAKKNAEANKNALGYGNATKYYNKETGEYQDTDPNKPTKTGWWWR